MAQSADIKRFSGRRVLITGAARGIGLATAERFADEGARLLLTDCRASDLEATARMLSRRHGTEALACAMDVSQRADVERMMALVEARWSGVDVLINNAGIANKTAFLDLSEAAWDETIAINLKGCFLVGQAVAREMARARSGVIVNMASSNGLAAEPDCAHYNASKGGVVLLTKSMALDLAPHGIRVNCVAPGFILTPLARACVDEATRAEYVRTLVPLRRTGAPEEVASVMAFLASDDAAFMTGAAIAIDGGQLAF